ncbi:uncharacterized protein LOC129587736 [Paramacrobiotus metropolitanus]|uniref:uncharacterized protein LOC129587736 n=1 Tax=Paramacrobiotus metropolitanus TaxID=2943436 RepID=UPI0024460B6B|nr:uncharacterized protein LOC129587736 [Paramacrobiotus metropolitanus]
MGDSSDASRSSDCVRKRLEELKRKHDSCMYTAIDKELQISRADDLAQKYRSVSNLCTAPASGDRPTLFCTPNNTQPLPVFDSVEAIRSEFKQLEKGLNELAEELLPAKRKNDMQKEPLTKT